MRRERYDWRKEKGEERWDKISRKGFEDIDGHY